MAVLEVKQKCARRWDKVAATRTSPVKKKGEAVYFVRLTTQTTGSGYNAATSSQAVALGLPRLGSSWDPAEIDLKAKSYSLRGVVVEIRFVTSIRLPLRHIHVLRVFGEREFNRRGFHRRIFLRLRRFAFVVIVDSDFKEPPACPLDFIGALSIGGPWVYGNRICNSAGNRFDTTIQKTYYDAVITVERNVRRWNLETMQAAMDAINSDAFTLTYRGQVWPIGEEQALMSAISAKSAFANGIDYFRAHYEMRLRKFGWHRRVCDMGLKELISVVDPGKTRAILDNNEQPVVEAVPLDGHGRASTEATQNGDLVATFIAFQLHKKYKFGDLNLDKPGNVG